MKTFLFEEKLLSGKFYRIIFFLGEITVFVNVERCNTFLSLCHLHFQWGKCQMSKTEIFATLWLLNLLLQCCMDHGSYAIRREILPLLEYFLEINQGHQGIGGKKNLNLLVTNIIFTWSPLKPPDLSMMLSISSGNNTITISTWAMSALVRVYKSKFWKSYIKYQLCSWSGSLKR